MRIAKFDAQLTSSPPPLPIIVPEEEGALDTARKGVGHVGPFVPPASDTTRRKQY